MISIQPHWNVIIGITVTVVLGFGVGCIVRHVGDSRTLGELTPPNETVRDQWLTLTKHNTGGWWIGFFERPIFFAAICYPTLILMMPTWFVFKAAFYWQSTNFTEFPPTLDDTKAANYLVAKMLLGNHRCATALVGTAANVVIALIGVAVTKWIKLQ